MSSTMTPAEQAESERLTRELYREVDDLLATRPRRRRRRTLTLPEHAPRFAKIGVTDEWVCMNLDVHLDGVPVTGCTEVSVDGGYIIELDMEATIAAAQDGGDEWVYRTRYGKVTIAWKELT